MLAEKNPAKLLEGHGFLSPEQCDCKKASQKTSLFDRFCVVLSFRTRMNPNKKKLKKEILSASGSYIAIKFLWSWGR